VFKAFVNVMQQQFNQLFNLVSMKTNSQNQAPEQNEKHSGGWHIFLFLGIALVILVLLKLLVDKFVS